LLRRGRRRSDGKLTTRIGRNSAAVRTVLETLVTFGAPQRILLDGKPHLGTDNLVRLLKGFRAELLRLGADILWDARVQSLILKGGEGGAEGEGAAEGGGGVGSAAGGGRVGCGGVAGVVLASGERVLADAVVLAAGHSARELYQELLRCGATLAPKDFAVGFRIEHPQGVVDAAQYGEELAVEHCKSGGRGRLPPASYRLAANVATGASSSASSSSSAISSSGSSNASNTASGGAATRVAAAADAAEGAAASTRGVFSFCMCPGGQIVPTSLEEGRRCAPEAEDAYSCLPTSAREDTQSTVFGRVQLCSLHSHPSCLHAVL